MLDPRQNVRRRIAKTCFVMIVTVFIFSIGFIVFGNSEHRLNIASVSGIIMTLLAFCTTLVMGYGASVHHSDIKND